MDIVFGKVRLDFKWRGFGVVCMGVCIGVGDIPPIKERVILGGILTPCISINWGCF